MKDKNEQLKVAILGHAVGDALGVPVEFQMRSYLKEHPVVDMIGEGTYNVPLGTYSDDTAMSLCLLEALQQETFDLDYLAQQFVKWKNEAYWAATNFVFDIGITTRSAIKNIEIGKSPVNCGGSTLDSNGNGSLMRILPLAFYIRGFDIGTRYQFVKSVSSITHAHYISVFACFIYIEIALELINGNEIRAAYYTAIKKCKSYLPNLEEFYKVGENFDRFLSRSIINLKESEIKSTGYVVHTLEASIWCLLNSSSYSEAVLKAVSLGDDTDTTAAVTGGLAGIVYGIDDIPKSWLNQLARKEDIIELIDKSDLK